MRNKNPWLALSTYEEKDEHSFFGRDEDIDRMFAMIQQNESVVCYSASGDGKSSLINAGLCPKLRRNDMFPVKVMFTSNDFNNSRPDFDETIAKRIHQAIQDYQNLMDEEIKDIGIVRPGNYLFVKLPEYKDFDLPNDMWVSLRTHKIKDPFGGNILTPVLIFDQFEEIFRSSWKAEFFNWLERLSSDVCPEDVVGSLSEKTDNLPSRKLFKLLFSMRYEYVGELDYWCSQRNFIPQMMRNRYFLKPLNTENAISIIKSMADIKSESEQNQNVVDDSVLNSISDKLSEKAEVIVEKIKKSNANNSSAAAPNDSDEVSAIALSLVCHVLYDNLENDESFSLDDNDKLERIINNGIYNYYDEQLDAIEVPQQVREAIEEVLSPNNDRPRIPATLPRLQEIHIEEYIYEKKDENGNAKPNLISTHILKKESVDNVNYIEFIHDRLVLAIAEHKEEEKRIEAERIEREKIKQKLEEERHRAKRRKIILNCFYGFLGIVIALFVVGLVLKKRIAKPIEFRYEAIKSGDTIPILKKFYSIPNEKLILKNCTVLPYTFAGNDNLKCIVLDSVRIIGSAIPSADTLFLTGKQLKLMLESGFTRLVYPKEFLTKFKVITVEKPISFKEYSDRKVLFVDSLNRLEPLSKDSAIFKKHRGALYVMDELDSLQGKRIWYPIFTVSVPIMVDDGFFGNDSIALPLKSISTFDLAQNNDSILHEIKDVNNQNVCLKLICSNNNKDTLRRVDIPDCIKQSLVEVELPHIKVIESSTFSNCTNLSSINLESIPYVGDSTFYGCHNLIKLSLPAAKHIGRSAFDGCNKLEHLSLPLANSIDNHAFWACYHLEQLFLPQAISIGDFAFSYANVLTELYLPQTTSIGDHAFENCFKLERLTELSLPKATSIGNYAFANCNNLEHLSLPQITTIGDCAFSGAKVLTELSLPKAISIGKHAFDNADALTDLSLPCANSIGDYAFAYCDSLKTVVLDSVRCIGSYSFSGAPLYDVYIPQVDSIKQYAFKYVKENVKVVYNKNAFIGDGNAIFKNQNNNALSNNSYNPNTQLDSIFERLKTIDPYFNNSIINNIEIQVGDISKPDSAFYNNVHYSIEHDDDGYIIIKRTSDNPQPVLFCFFYSDTIHNLKINIPYSTIASFSSKKIPIVDTFTLRSSNTSVMDFYGDLVSYNRNPKQWILLARSNREEYVSLHPKIVVSYKYPHGNKCNKYVALYRTAEIDAFVGDKTARNVTLVVPYGQIEYYQKHYGDVFGKIEELKWWKTLTYRVKYDKDPSETGYITIGNIIRGLIGSIVESIKGGNTSDLLSVLLFVIVSFVITIVLNWFGFRNYTKPLIKSKWFWIDFSMTIITYATGGAIVFFSHHLDDSSFSMWPAWKYALPLLIIYLAITIILLRRNNKPTNNEQL